MMLTMTRDERGYVRALSVHLKIVGKAFAKQYEGCLEQCITGARRSVCPARHHINPACSQQSLLYRI